MLSGCQAFEIMSTFDVREIGGILFRCATTSYRGNYLSNDIAATIARWHMVHEE